MVVAVHSSVIDIEGFIHELLDIAAYAYQDVHVWSAS